MVWGVCPSVFFSTQTFESVFFVGEQCRGFPLPFRTPTAGSRKAAAQEVTVTAVEVLEAMRQHPAEAGEKNRIWSKKPSWARPLPLELCTNMVQLFHWREGTTPSSRLVFLGEQGEAVPLSQLPTSATVHPSSGARLNRVLESSEERKPGGGGFGGLVSGRRGPFCDLPFPENMFYVPLAVNGIITGHTFSKVCSLCGTYPQMEATIVKEPGIRSWGARDSVLVKLDPLGPKQKCLKILRGS